VFAPRKKKQGTTTSSLVTAAPGLLPCAAPLQPSAPSFLPALACQTATPTHGQAHPTQAS